MSDKPRPAYGTRRRVVIPLVLGFGAVAGMASMTSRNVLAVDFPTATDSYRVYSDRLVADSFAGYADAQTVSGGAQKGMAQLALGSANLSGLCLIAHHEAPGLGQFSIVLTAGEPVDGKPSDAAPLSLDKLEVSASSVTGDGSDVERLALGASAERLTSGGEPWQGPAGEFGVQANKVTLDGKQIAAAGMRLGSPAALPGLKIRVVSGDGGVAEAGASAPASCS